MHGQNETGNPVEGYLLRFRTALGNTPEAEKNEIVSDIRSHIADRVEESGKSTEEAAEEILRALGTPESLAQTYRAEGLLNRATASFSPWLLLRVAFTWAMTGLEGFFVLLLLFAGYAVALSFFACALLKPIFPKHVGMWLDPPLFTFGMHPPSMPAAHELLGWWIIPVSVLLGVAAFLLTTRLSRWWMRRFGAKLRSARPAGVLRAFALICLITLSLRAQAPSLVGKWTGVLDAGAAKLHIGIEVTSGSNGTLNGTMSVLEQGVTGLPIDTISLQSGHVAFAIARIGGAYEGTLQGDHIEGTWSQGGHRFPLNFSQGTAAAPVLKRPQNPTPPFPYNTEDVTVPSGKITLAGTFSSPKSGGPFASLVLVTGSGPEDRDETLFGHKPFLVIADYLTRAGFAVLRLDDRGTAKSTGDYKAAGLQEFTDDALAAVAWLKSRHDIDPKKIGILGHSEGGAIAPLAADRCQDVAFVILLAGPGIPFDELMYRQEADMMRAQGAPESLIAENRSISERIFTILREEPDRAKAAARLDAVVAELRTRSPELANVVQQQVRGMVLPEFRSLLSYNPSETLSKVKCPVLALDGSKDLQVSANQNLPAIAKALADGGNPDFTVEEFPGLNHLFQDVKTGSVSEYALTEETISPRALLVIRDWLVAHTRG